MRFKFLTFILFSSVFLFAPPPVDSFQDLIHFGFLLKSARTDFYLTDPYKIEKVVQKDPETYLVTVSPTGNHHGDPFSPVLTMKTQQLKKLRHLKEQQGSLFWVPHIIPKMEKARKPDAICIEYNQFGYGQNEILNQPTQIGYQFTLSNVSELNAKDFNRVQREELLTNSKQQYYIQKREGLVPIEVVGRLEGTDKVLVVPKEQKHLYHKDPDAAEVYSMDPQLIIKDSDDARYKKNLVTWNAAQPPGVSSLNRYKMNRVYYCDGVFLSITATKKVPPAH